MTWPRRQGWTQAKLSPRSRIRSRASAEHSLRKVGAFSLWTPSEFPFHRIILFSTSVAQSPARPAGSRGVTADQPCRGSSRGWAGLSGRPARHVPFPSEKAHPADTRNRSASLLPRRDALHRMSVIFPAAEARVKRMPGTRLSREARCAPQSVVVSTRKLVRRNALRRSCVCGLR